jgi:flavin reductase (DIM6/NTAB) family NADH-FMN oxidoreductase RutF
MSVDAPLPAVDPAAIRAVHRRFVTGVTVVATVDDGQPKGLAVNAFMSLSLDPPLIMVAVQRTSGTYPSLFSSEYFSVNILSAGQRDVVECFAKKGADKFAGLNWQPGPFGSPLLEGCAARVEVRIRERLQASTHTVFVGHVLLAESYDVPPLVYADGRFGSAADLVVT